MDKPSKGTTEFLDWMIESVIQSARELEIPVSKLKRDDFLQVSQLVTRSDIDFLGRWTDLRKAASARYISMGEKVIRGPIESGEPSPPPFAPVPDGYFVKEIGTELDANGEPTKQWVKAPMNKPPGEIITDFVPDGHEISGLSTLVSGDGYTTQQWIKTKAKKKSREEILREVIESLDGSVTKRVSKIKPPESTDSDLLSVYPMGDPHIGMLSWAPETGENFNLEKAEAIMCTAMDELVIRGPRSKKALLVNLGDFFHSDSSENRTARSGHHLDVDGRWPKILKVGLDIMLYMTDRALEHHEEVHVINEIGNHDDHSAVMLSVAMNAYYSKEPRVTIDMSPSRFHWYRFHENLIGVHHGHSVKHNELESLMANERKEDWGETTHRFWLCGHIHHSTRKETRGCVIESFRTLAARDAYAANAGYKSGRDMNRIVLHKEFGEVSREIVNAQALKMKYRLS